MLLNVQKHGSGVQCGQTVASLFQNGLERPELDCSGQLAGIVKFGHFQAVLENECHDLPDSDSRTMSCTSKRHVYIRYSFLVGWISCYSDPTFK